MLKPDPQKEFQLNPLTAIVPFHGDFAVVSKQLEQIEVRTIDLKATLNDPVELKTFNEQAIKKMQAELDMLKTILMWAGIRQND